MKNNQRLNIRELLAVLLLQVFIISTPALTLKNIPFDTSLLSADCKEAIEEVKHVEPLCTYWSPRWDNVLPRDTVKSILFSALEKATNPDQGNFSSTLFRGIMKLPPGTHTST